MGGENKSGMTQVSVTIAGHIYRMACAQGEEEHLQELAHQFEARIEMLRQNFGEIGDQRLVMMTAITVADELSEAKVRIATLEAELSGLRTTKSEGEALRDALADDIAVSLSEAAERIERIAHELNGAGREQN